MSTHLPLLLNPLLNVIFNNSLHNKAPFKETIKTLSLNHSKILILVPPTQFLSSEFDTESGTSFQNLCYHNEEFIQSHILKTDTTQKIFTTLNDKQILIKKDSIFTGRGFKKSLKLNILSVETFRNFADYFPLGSEFTLIYIDEPLLGSVATNPPVTPPETSHTSQKVPSIFNFSSETPITFEQVLRQFPLASKTIADDLRKLFSDFNVKSKSLAIIRKEFRSTINAAYRIFQNLPFNLVQNILDAYPSINLNQSIHDYIELNIYDKIWFQISADIPDNLFSIYSQLSCTSLNQVGIPNYKPWEMIKIQKHVSLAITEFSKIANTGNNSANKAKIFIDTFHHLTKIDDLVINADTLVGLLLLVVIHSQVKDLSAHIYYVRNFNYLDFEVEGGYLSYVLSTLEAVIFHVEDEENLRHLVKYSEDNNRFWNMIREADTERIYDELLPFQDGAIENDHYIKSVTPQGESCLMMSVQSNNYDVFQTLIDFVNIFQMEDILLDRTVTDSTLLSIALQLENRDIVEKLISIVSEATYEEQVYYYNIKDIYQRNIGHYLFHSYEIIPRIGHFIDWTQKDLNHQTPLFTICRSYDQSDYTQLIKYSFEAVDKSNTEKSTFLDFDAHIDGRGNTLLHVLNNSLPMILKYDTIDVNKANQKHYSPLAVYARYNRTENIDAILSDERLDFARFDHNSFNIFDHSSKNKGLLKKFCKYYYTHFYPSIELKPNDFPMSSLVLFNSRYDSNLKVWFLACKLYSVSATEHEKVMTDKDIVDKGGDESKIEIDINTCINNNNNNTTKDNNHFNNNNNNNNIIFEEKENVLYRSTADFKELYDMMKTVSPNSFLPNASKFWVNFPDISTCYQIFPKFRVNKLMAQLTLLFKSISFNETLNNQGLIELFVSSTNQRLNLLEEQCELLKIRNVKALSKFENLHLKQQQINEIEFFLNFSLNDLRKYQSLTSKLSKLLTFTIYKEQDVKLVWGNLFSTIAPDFNLNPYKKFQKIGDTIREVINDYDKSYDGLSSAEIFVEMSVLELMANINSLLDTIDEWWETYNMIIEANSDIKKYEKDIPRSLSRRGSQNTLNSSITHHTSNESPKDLTLNKQPSINFSLNLGGILENKKSKYKKLLSSKNDLDTKILNLNRSIKYKHELIALEINNFIDFRSNFIKHALKLFVNEQLRVLKYKRNIFEKGLENFKSVSRFH